MVSPGYVSLCSQSTIPITGKRPYKLFWGGLGFLPAFLFFCLLLSQELWKSELHPSVEEGKKSKTPCGTGHCGAHLVGVHDSLGEMSRESKARSRCLRGLWRGERGCVRGADKFLPWQRHPNWNLWESIYNKTLLARCLAVIWLHPRNGGIRMKLPHHTFLAITAASLSMKQNLPSSDSSENWSKKTSAMLLCLEARAKQGSLLSKTFPSLMLQSQDAHNKLAGWDFGRFCTYLREQRCYHKIAEKNNRLMI